MSNTFTAQELSDLYQKAADGGEIEFRVNCTNKQWFSTSDSPSLSSVRQDWRIKPVKKVIDLTVLIKSGIQPRRNHKQSWQGGECPLPEGFEVKVWYRDDSRCTDTLMNSGMYKNTGWVHRNNGRDIIAFEVLGVVDGYVMTWEQ